MGESQLGVGDLAVLAPGQTVEALAGPDGAKAMLLGGAAIDGPRHIWWNFVSSSKERIEKAKEDFQRRYVLEVLERNHGNRTQTARDLGVDPRTIFRYLEREQNPLPSGGNGPSNDPADR